MHRSATRLTRILACAVVPVMLVVAGCSSDSDSKDDAEAPAAPSVKASPTVAPAKYSGLPDACKTLASKTVRSLVPEAKSKGGTAGKSSDTDSRASCSWNGLDDKGVDGSQYRWLDISLVRYDSDAALGPGASRAGDYYKKAVDGAKGTEGAKDVKAEPASGLGNEGTLITYTLKKSGENFSYATVVARAENIVMTFTYNGTGYAGAKDPSVGDLSKEAVKAAKEAVTAATSDGGGSGAGGSGPSASASKGASEDGTTNDFSKDAKES
ncbi:DUF3558 domain-containing protein [Streptomyces hebeiensis]